MAQPFHWQYDANGWMDYSNKSRGVIEDPCWLLGPQSRANHLLNVFSDSTVHAVEGILNQEALHKQKSTKHLKVSCNEKLMWAAKENNSAALKAAVASGANVNHREHSDAFTKGENALMLATRHGHEDMVKLLLRYGAAFDLTDDFGHTAVMIAAWHNHPGILKLLLSKGASHDAVGCGGWTPLIRACAFGHPRVVQLLLLANANTEHRCEKGMNALNYCKREQRRVATQRDNCEEAERYRDVFVLLSQGCSCYHNRV